MIDTLRKIRKNNDKTAAGPTLRAISLILAQLDQNQSSVNANHVNVKPRAKAT